MKANNTNDWNKEEGLAAVSIKDTILPNPTLIS